MKYLVIALAGFIAALLYMLNEKWQEKWKNRNNTTSKSQSDYDKVSKPSFDNTSSTVQDSSKNVSASTPKYVPRVETIDRNASLLEEEKGYDWENNYNILCDVLDRDHNYQKKKKEILKDTLKYPSWVVYLLLIMFFQFILMGIIVGIFFDDTEIGTHIMKVSIIIEYITISLVGILYLIKNIHNKKLKKKMITTINEIILSKNAYHSLPYEFKHEFLEKLYNREYQ